MVERFTGVVPLPFEGKSYLSRGGKSLSLDQSPPVTGIEVPAESAHDLQVLLNRHLNASHWR